MHVPSHTRQFVSTQPLSWFRARDGALLLCANYCLLKMHCATFESRPLERGERVSESVYATRPSPLDRTAQVTWVTTTHTQEILTISPNARTTTKYAIITPMSAHSRFVAPTFSSMVSAGVRSLSRDVPSPDRVQDSWENVLTWTAHLWPCDCVTCAVGRRLATVSTPLEDRRGQWAWLRRCRLRSHLFIFAAHLRCSANIFPALKTFRLTFLRMRDICKIISVQRKDQAFMV